VKTRAYEMIKKTSFQKQRIILLEKMHGTVKLIDSYGQCGVLMQQCLTGYWKSMANFFK
jgi:hypothetical protein